MTMMLLNTSQETGWVNFPSNTRWFHAMPPHLQELLFFFYNELRWFALA